jgi:hypothetical protein
MTMEGLHFREISEFLFVPIMQLLISSKATKMELGFLSHRESIRYEKQIQGIILQGIVKIVVALSVREKKNDA